MQVLPGISGVDPETEASDTADPDVAIPDPVAEVAKRGVVSEGISLAFY